MTDLAESSPLHQGGAVAVVGCHGRMGSMLMREGRAAGLGMTGVDTPYDSEELSRLLSKTRIVVLCVPAAVFGSVLKNICPHMPEEAVLCDITSVKVTPLRQMESLWSGSIVGTHPLFGPEPDRSTQLSVAVMKGRNCTEADFQLVREFFHAMKFDTFVTDAVEHDRAMAKIQNMNFITSLAYCAQTAGDDSLIPYITPSFRRRLEAAKKLLTVDGTMFSGLFEANPYSQEAVRQFSKILSLASAGDIDLLLNRARWWWKEEKF